MEVYGQSDIGRRRKTNQDRFIIKQYGNGLTVCAVFDGMGGNKGGEEASTAALAAFEERADAMIGQALENNELITRSFIEKVLRAAVSDANGSVCSLGRTPELAGLGTTVVAAAVTQEFVVAVNAGDSRLYEAGRGSLKQVSKDNSYVQYLVDIGQITEQEAENHPQKNLITKCLGTDPELEPDVYRLTYVPDILLLCSDGLTNAVSGDDIYDVITSDKSVQDRVAALIDAANGAGGPDNITAILAVND